MGPNKHIILYMTPDKELLIIKTLEGTLVINKIEERIELIIHHFEIYIYRAHANIESPERQQSWTDVEIIHSIIKSIIFL